MSYLPGSFSFRSGDLCPGAIFHAIQLIDLQWYPYIQFVHLRLKRFNGGAQAQREMGSCLSGIDDGFGA